MLSRNSSKIHACCLVLCALVSPAAGMAASWTKLTDLAPGTAGVMLQLTDGTIMVQNSGTASWMRLTPDPTGNYINGVWTN
jgi:hypothetical protein